MDRLVDRPLEHAQLHRLRQREGDRELLLDLFGGQLYCILLQRRLRAECGHVPEVVDFAVFNRPGHVALALQVFDQLELRTLRQTPRDDAAVAEVEGVRVERGDGAVQHGVEAVPVHRAVAVPLQRLEERLQPERHPEAVRSATLPLAHRRRLRRAQRRQREAADGGAGGERRERGAAALPRLRRALELAAGGRQPLLGEVAAAGGEGCGGGVAWLEA
mmetsp:Transcript_15614/g.33069  ORF Transcript_15614/g.33069 Transcript_15614/m.33069 type:complete len:218 (-) Transcript_15614:110-763(-)